jgi:hypothetical protein
MAFQNEGQQKRPANQPCALFGACRYADGALPIAVTDRSERDGREPPTTMTKRRPDPWHDEPTGSGADTRGLDPEPTCPRAIGEWPLTARSADADLTPSGRIADLTPGVAPVWRIADLTPGGADRRPDPRVGGSQT